MSNLKYYIGFLKNFLKELTRNVCTSWLELISRHVLIKTRQNIMIEYQIKHIFSPLLLLTIQHEKYHFLLTFQKHFNHSLSYRFSL